MTVDAMQFVFDDRSLRAEEVMSLNEGEPAWILSIRLFVQQWYDQSETIMTTSSGTTGNKKPIPLAKHSMCLSARRTNKYFGITEMSRLLLCLPADYIAGKMMIVRAIEAGAVLECAEPSLTPVSLHTPTIDFAAMTAAQLRSLLEEPIEPSIVSRLSTVLLGGGPVADELIDLIHDRDLKVYHGFGMTETCSHIALRPLNGPQSSDEYSIIQDVSVSRDQGGCLCISGEIVPGGNLVTEDQVEIIDSRHFRWLGRRDNMINSGGIKLYPELLEETIKSHLPDDFPEFFIGGVDDSLLGQRAVLILAQSELSGTIHELLEKAVIASEIGPAAPKDIHCVSEFLYTPTGKLRRSETLAKLSD